MHPGRLRALSVFPCAAAVSVPLWGVLIAGWAALSSGICLHSNPELQERRQSLIHKIHQLADLRYRSFLFLVLWEQELGCVPWSPDIHPTLGRRGRSIPTPWQCLCDPLRAAPVLNALLLSFSIDCGQEKFVGRAPSSPWGGREDNEGS